MENSTRLINKEDFSIIYKNLHNDKSLVETLISMQLESGVSDRKAAENAEAMISDVCCRWSVLNMLSNDARGTFNSFLNKSKKMTGYDRKLLLHEIYFGLKVYHDEELADRIKDGETIDQLFREYYRQCGEDPDFTEDYLQQHILDMVGDYNISNGTVDLMARRLEESGDMLATSAILGEEGLRFKCVAAMDLYLRYSKDLTIEAAVDLACTDAEIQAVSDAVSTGEITRRNALILLSIIIMAMCLAGLAMMLMPSQMIDVLAYSVDNVVTVQGIYTNLYSEGFSLLAAGGLSNFFHIDAWLSRLAGEAAANMKYRYFIKKEESRAAEELKNMAAENIILQEDTKKDTDDNNNRNRHYNSNEAHQTLNASN